MHRKTFSGIMLTLLLTSMLALAFNIRLATASGIIYIRADGSIEGTTKISSADNVTYYLTDNIQAWFDPFEGSNFPIVVQRSNIIVDGNGYYVSGGKANGFQFSGVNNVTIQNMEIFSDLQSAIEVNNVNNLTVQDATLYSLSRHSIWLSSSSFATITGNKMSDAGVSLSLSSFSTITGNDIGGTRNLPSIALSSSSFNTITGNNIGLLWRSATGVAVSESSTYNVISGNNITNNDFGIQILSSSDNTVFGNHISNNLENGLRLSNSSNNHIYHNNFVDNFKQVDSQVSTNLWDNSYPSGGNYWSDYAVVDANDDGIGDTPYIIDANNRDRYPLMNPWGQKGGTKIRFTLALNPASPGQLITLLGNLTVVGTGNAIGNARVDVYANNAFYASLWTNSTGWFKGNAYVGLGTYQINVTYAGNAYYNPTSHTETLTVQQPLESWIYFDFSPNPTTPGDSVTLGGILVDSLSKPVNSAAVRVEYSTNDGASWSYIWTLTTNQYGMFSQSFPAPAVGRYLVRVSYPGDLAHKSFSNKAYLIVLSSVPGGTTAGSIFFNFNPNPVKLGSSDVLRGTLLDASNKPVPSVSVKVEYSMNNGATWTYIWTLTTNQYGIFSNTFTAPAKGTYLVRASYSTSNMTTYLLIQ